MIVRGIHRPSRRLDVGSRQYDRQQTFMRDYYGFSDPARLFVPDGAHSEARRRRLATASYYGPTPVSRRWHRQRERERLSVLSIDALRSAGLRTTHRRLIGQLDADDEIGFGAELRRLRRQTGLGDRGAAVDPAFVRYACAFAGLALAATQHRRLERVEQTSVIRAVATDRRFFGGLCSADVVEFVVRGLSGVAKSAVNPSHSSGDVLVAALAVTAMVVDVASANPRVRVGHWSRLELLTLRALRPDRPVREHRWVGTTPARSTAGGPAWTQDVNGVVAGRYSQ
jgi:hypothetical protein